MDRNFLDDVVGVVEANSFERMCLWKEYKANGKTWVQNLSGCGINVGYITAQRPVFISLTTAVVDGHKILFVEPTSISVDHGMIGIWLKSNVPSAIKENGYLNVVDAGNFFNVFPR